MKKMSDFLVDSVNTVRGKRAKCVNGYKATMDDEVAENFLIIITRSSIKCC